MHIYWDCFIIVFLKLLLRFVLGSVSKDISMLNPHSAISITYYLFSFCCAITISYLALIRNMQHSMKHWSRKLKGWELLLAKFQLHQTHTTLQCRTFHITSRASFLKWAGQAQMIPKMYRCPSFTHFQLACLVISTLWFLLLVHKVSQTRSTKTLSAVFKVLISAAGTHTLWSLRALLFLPVKAAVHSEFSFSKSQFV